MTKAARRLLVFNGYFRVILVFVLIFEVCSAEKIVNRNAEIIRDIESVVERR